MRSNLVVTLLNKAVHAFRNWEGEAVGSLTAPFETGDGAALRVFHRVTTALGVLVLALIGIAAVAPLRVTALAAGQIVPEGSTRPVYHLEGGVVADILVRAGDLVEKDAPLIQMAPVGAASENLQLESKSAFLTSQRVRLSALLKGEPVDFSSIGEEHAHFAEDEAALHQQDEIAFERETAILKARRAQQEATRAALGRQLTSARRSRDAHKRQNEVVSSLLEQGFASQSDGLEAESNYLRAEIDVTRLEGEYVAAQEAENEAAHALDQLIATRRQEWSKQISDIDAQLFELQAMSLRSQDKVDRLIVRAPHRGIVQEIAPKSPGDVLRAGDPAATLVPLGKEIVAEVRLRPQDSGHVRIGQRARVQATAFDPELYGTIEGEVRAISPTTFEDRDGAAYFKATISLGDGALRRGKKTFPLTPGMEVTANIVTDERSLLSYLLKPVNRAFRGALTER